MNDPSRILLISEVFPPATGGSGRWLWEVYSRLDPRGVVVAAGQHPDADAFDRRAAMPIQRLPLRFADWGILSLEGFIDHRAAARELRRLVAGYSIRQIHSGRILPEGFLALGLAARLDVPITQYIHGEELNTVSTSRQLRWMARRVLRRAERVIANSRNTAAILRRDWQVPPSRITVMHPGVCTQRFRPAARDIELRSALGWGDRPVILTVGRLQERKGHDQMIRAMAALRARVPDAMYAIIGAGEQRASLEALAQTMQLSASVQFLGELSDDDLIHAYQQADLFVLANRQINGDFEGFGMVLVEAQACGTPVIAGASGGTAETMQPGVTGMIVDCEQPALLAAAAADLLLDEPRRAAMARAARRWAVSRFDWTALTRQSADLFGVARDQAA